jgi:hypothetical protein
MEEPVKKSTSKPKSAASKTKSSTKPQKKSAANGVPSNVTEMKVSHDQVAELAHRFWAERGHQHGYDAEDWFRAEQALRSKAS